MVKIVNPTPDNFKSAHSRFPVVPTQAEIPGGTAVEDSVDYFTNDHIANHLEKIKDILQRSGDLQRVYAYSRAVNAIRSHSIPVSKMDLKAGDIKYVGPAIVQTIEEFIESGMSNRLRDLEKEFPPLPDSLKELEKVSGLGPVKIAKLHKEFGVLNLADLQKLIDSKPDYEFVASLKQAVHIALTEQPRIPIDDALVIGDPILDVLRNWAEVIKVSYAGSIRRKLPTVKDIDIVVAVSEHNRKTVRDKIKAAWPEDVYADGPSKTRLRVKGRQLDIVFSGLDCWGASLAYFTGSQAHNILVREHAASKGLKLNEFGLNERKTGMFVSGCPDERFLYQLLGLKYVEPEDRTDKKLETL